MGTIKDLTGQTFGRWTVIDFAKLYGEYAYWNCVCNCENKTKKVVRSHGLISGRSKSCGCLQKEITSKRSIKDFGRNSKANAIYKNTSSGAGRRGYAFQLSYDNFIGIVSKPCYYCDEPPNNDYNGYSCSGIDRLDNTKGYILENCVPCCKKCNRAKYIYTEDEFKRWIYKAYHHIYG